MVASMLAEITFPYLGPYNIAKHGVIGLCDTLRQELLLDGAEQVSVCTVLPMVFDTPLFRLAGNRTGRPLRTPPPAAPASWAARRIVRVIERPRRQVRAGIGASVLTAHRRLAPALTERLLARYADRAAFRPGSTTETSGNLFDPLHREGEQQMARTEHTITATADEVFAVLADGWTYSDWVVGTAHIRDVDANWPECGSRIHHKAGPWPFSLHERTVSLECEPPRRLVMRPRLWPFGEATVRITLTEIDVGRTRIVIEEQFIAGPLLAARNRLNDLVLGRRNAESLRRLADIVERSQRPRL
jgi:uncharacterized protein YndB with AHSA1/START domain